MENRIVEIHRGQRRRSNITTVRGNHSLTVVARSLRQLCFASRDREEAWPALPANSMRRTTERS